MHGSVADAGDQAMSFTGAKVQLERVLRKTTQITEKEEGERNKTEKREEDEKMKLTVIGYQGQSYHLSTKLVDFRIFWT